tara:strand:- start:6596 stop:7432 length:837 start_codon:yes stop_codon:yes gene_type:complete
MKNLIFILILNVFTLKSQCDYQYTSATFPSSLTINSGETLCVNQDVITAGTTITLNSGGIIRVYNNSTFKVNGSLSIIPGGKVHIEDCNSKLEVLGSYTGGTYNDCEILVNCAVVESINYLNYNSKPKVFFDNLGGTPGWPEVCKDVTLPVELISYICDKKEITWSTGSEINSDYFSILYSDNGINFTPIANINARGNSFEVVNYSYPITKQGYYKLTQTDYDGTTENFDIKLCGSDSNKITLVASYDVLGQTIPDSYRGIVLEVYSDGSTKRIYKAN